MIHPTALVAPEARIGSGSEVGPYCVIGPEVELAEEVELRSHVVIQGRTRIGRGCRVHAHAVLGTEPQDLSYRGEPTAMEIGPDTVIREYVTVNRGTAKGGGLTRVGSGCLLMAYAHVAHDCQIGDGAILANSIAMAGHVEIGAQAVLGGISAFHQFVRVGRMAMVGGLSGVSQDVIPFGMVVGNRTRLAGLNLVGMRRAGLSRETIQAIKEVYRLLMRSGLNTSQALTKIEEELGEVPEVREIMEFIRSSRRGICKG